MLSAERAVRFVTHHGRWRASTMSSTRRQMLLNLFKIFDLLIMVSAFALATVAVLQESGGGSFSDFFTMRVKVQNFLIFVIFLLVWYLIFASLGLYESRRFIPRRAEVLDTLKATLLGTFCLGSAAVAFHVRMIDPTFIAVFGVSSGILAVSSRLALKYILEHVRKQGRNLRHVLIVGTNTRAIEFAKKIESNPELGYRIIGFVDREWTGMEEFRKAGYSLVCNFEKFVEFIRATVVDEVVIALPLKSFYFHASRIAALCEEQGIVLRFLPRMFNLRMARSVAEDFEGDSLLTLYTGPLDGWPVFAKRALDFVLSLSTIIILSPLFIVTAILVKLSSPGPVFFNQERLGLNKRRFHIVKFRTMIPNAEQMLAELERLNEVSGPVFKIKNDPRLTSIGKFLRKTSIDELPQLFNVLKGDMSLVGPRPLPVRDYEGFDQDWHRRRFSIRPGITCLWQVNGRSSVPFEKWMELDMRYIDEWSLWLDLKILAGTIPAVLRGSGAA